MHAIACDIHVADTACNHLRKHALHWIGEGIGQRHRKETLVNSHHRRQPTCGVLDVNSKSHVLDQSTGAHYLHTAAGGQINA